MRHCDSKVLWKVEDTLTSGAILNVLLSSIHPSLKYKFIKIIVTKTMIIFKHKLPNTKNEGLNYKKGIRIILKKGAEFDLDLEETIEL